MTNKKDGLGAARGVSRHEKIAADVAEFLARGGLVEEVPTGAATSTTGKRYSSKTDPAKQKRGPK